MEPIQKNGDLLLEAVAAAEKAIEAFNDHLLNHDQVVPSAAIALAGLLYIGVVDPIVANFSWSASGLLAVGIVGIYVWRKQRRKNLDARLETAVAELKAYEKERRKKKRRRMKKK